MNANKLHNVVNFCQKCKWHILAWILALILMLIFYLTANPFADEYTFKWWHELIGQISAILWVGSISIGLVQCSIWAVNQFREGRRLIAFVVISCLIIGLVSWGVIYLFIMSFGGSGGFWGLVMMNLPFAIPLYYMARNRRRTTYITFVICFVISLIYTYYTIDLKGPMMFAITDRPVDIPRTWFYSYNFYRVGMILSSAFAYSTALTILLFGAVKIKERLKS